MKPAIIAPIPLLDNLCITGVHVCYSSLVLESKIYSSFYAEKSRYGEIVIIDHSPGLRRFAGDPEDYIEAIRLVKPSVVVLPDYDFYMDKTIKASVSFYRRIRWESFVYVRSVIGVLQGSSLEEVFQCYSRMAGQVPVLGLAANLEKFNSRNLIIQEFGLKSPTAFIEVYKGILGEAPDFSSVHTMWSAAPLGLAYLDRSLNDPIKDLPVFNFYRKSIPLLGIQNLRDYIRVLSTRRINNV